MKRDIITSAIVFCVVLFIGLGLMYSNIIGSSSSSTSPTPSTPVVAQKSDAQLVKEMTITDETVGSGAEAKTGDTVDVNYVGTLQDGTKFDSSYDRNQPFSFTLGGNVIKGWNLGVVGMKVGGKRKLVIPPDLAYGDQKTGSIPANSTLTFEIELLDIK